MWNALPVIHTLLYLHDVQVLLKLTTKRLCYKFQKWTRSLIHPTERVEVSFKILADNILKYIIYYIFQRKQALTIHVNHLLFKENWNNSHVLPSFIFSEKIIKTFRILSVTVLNGNLRVNSCPAEPLQTV